MKQMERYNGLKKVAKNVNPAKMSATLKHCIVGGIMEIDENYYVNVKDLMKPRKKLYDIDGKRIPIIEVESWD